MVRRFGRLAEYGCRGCPEQLIAKNNKTNDRKPRLLNSAARAQPSHDPDKWIGLESHTLAAELAVEPRFMEVYRSLLCKQPLFRPCHCRRSGRRLAAVCMCWV
jgi:hypothetical protein